MRTMSEKKQAKAGRKAQAGKRHECGKLVQPTRKETERERKATVVSQRIKHLGLSRDEAGGKATVIEGLLKLGAERGGLSKQQAKTAEDIEQARAAYEAAIQIPRQRSASDYSGPRGAAASSISEDQERQAMSAVNRWKVMRTAILNSGPMGMMAVEALILNNQPINSLVGDLRLALNSVHHAVSRPKARNVECA